MKSGEKKKLIAVGVLLLVAVSWFYFALSPSSSAAAPDAASAHQGAISTLSKGDPAIAAPAPTRQHGRNLQDGLSIDPVLRLDLLAKAQKVAYEGSDRSIFQFYTPPPPPLPTAVVSPIIGRPGSTAPVTSTAPPPPPPPPSIPLKYYGVVTTVGSLSKKACLQDGEEIFVAAEGETVKKRYLVVRINDLGREHNVELEDTQTKVKAKVPLQESGDKG
jgi:hypothetical protein